MSVSFIYIFLAFCSLKFLFLFKLIIPLVLYIKTYYRGIPKYVSEIQGAGITDEHEELND